jgi:flagellar hook-associated protein 2
MSRIQSSIGLITDIPIQETVDKLIAVAARPRNLLSDRTNQLQAEQLAITQLTTLLAAFQFESNQLGSASLFDAKTVTSSDSAALSAAIAAGGNPLAGSYLFTPVQTAAANQFLSQSFTTDTAVGGGSFTIRTGGFVDKGISLDELNDGTGVQRGEIRITDRSGASAVIDLSFARTVDDVLNAINNETAISVTAVAVGDSFKLIDNSGGSGNLRVQEVGGGTTAVDLGLAAINVAASEATGLDVFTLHELTRLSTLNDGTGVQLRSGNDLEIEFADETTLSIDLGAATDLGDVLDVINAASPTKLSAAISADGNRIELTDLTTGSGTFAAANSGTGTAADDLGLTTTSVGDTITGHRLASGLRDTLVSSLNGGQGLGDLGDVDITNRDNVSFSVDLSAAETLGEIVDAINDQSTDVTAAINSARNGIVLTDNSGGSASNFIIADGDANESATKLGIVANVAATTVNSGELHRHQISEAALLSSLNGGQGISVGDFLITDTSGQVGAVDLNPSGNVATTVGDVIDRINALTIGVEARINDAGDGIVLVDTAGGSGTLTVAEVGSGTTAADLRILGTSETVDIEGTPTQVIDGTAIVTVTIDAEHTLADVVETINELDAGVTASVVNDGTGQRLSIVSNDTGAAGALLIDTTESPFALQEITQARDALLLYGANDAPGSGVLVSSSTSTFDNVLDGVTLTVKDGTLEPVTVTVATSSTSLTTAVQEFVDAFNSVRENLDEVTAFDAEALTTGILFGRNEPLRVESDLTRILTARFFGVGGIQSLEAIGLSLDDEGVLEFDKSEFESAYASDPESLKTLFTHETLGLAAKFDAALEQLAGANDSLLSSRSDALDATIETNNERIADWDERLERQRERLLLDFFRLETLVAQLREGLTALSALQVIPPLTSTRS